jgi:hypothetical protein
MQRYRRKTVWLFVGLGLASVGAALWHFRPNLNSIQTSRGSVVDLTEGSRLCGVELLQPAGIPRAELTANYGSRENVPPYGHDGEFESRERFGTNPADPFQIADQGLGTSDADTYVRNALHELSGQYAENSVILPKMDVFTAGCSKSSLKPITLLQAARGFRWLGVEEAARAFDRAAITKIEATVDASRAGDPEYLPLLHELDETGLLWELKDYDALTARFEIAARLNAPSSIGARRAHVQRAIAMYEGHRSVDGTKELIAAWQDAATMNDLTPPDKNELTWLSAITFIRARQFAQAAPYCLEVANGGGDRARRGAEMYVHCLTELGRIAEAQAASKKFHLISSPKLPPANAPPQ